jgi:hypothetical protein
MRPAANEDPMKTNLFAALPVALLLPFVAGLAAATRGVWSEGRVSTSAVFAALTTTFLALFVVVTRRRRPRAGVLAACHAAAWSPFIAVFAWNAISDPIVAGQAMRCGTGLMAFLIVGLPVAGLVCIALGIALGVGLAYRSTDRLIRTAATGAVGLALVAFAFAAPRMGRPDPDTYIESLDQVAVLQPGSEATLAGRSYRYERIDEPRPAQTTGDCRLTGLDDTSTASSCSTLRLRIDRGRDIAVVDSPFPIGRSSPYAFIAFRPSTGVVISISAADVADHIGPPIGWTLGAGMGGLLGLVLVVLASRIRRGAARIEGSEGTHAGEGWVELATGETLRIDAAVALPIGDVVLEQRTERVPTYRATGTPEFRRGRAGTLVRLRALRTDLAASLEAVAFATAALGAAPLVVARIVGVA